jgi:2',3'-cyclic-nucleotide 2'-phosphodiesterase/3'-nucleotidase
MLHPISRRTLLGGRCCHRRVWLMVHPFTARANANQAHLRIMETTDLHVHVFAYDYYGDKPNDTMGLARTASIINQIRSEGAEFDSCRQWRLPAGQPHGRLHRL